LHGTRVAAEEKNDDEVDDVGGRERRCGDGD
jgi:hypothetical protein